MLFITGAESHPELPGALEGAGVADGLKVIPTLNRYVGDMSDHEVFRRDGVPYFFLSCGRWAHYHQPTDTPDRLNFRKMARITRQVCELLRELDTRPLKRHSNPVPACDTLELETTWMRRACGPLWPLLLKRAGLQDICCRRDMDALVGSILSAGI